MRELLDAYESHLRVEKAYSPHTVKGYLRDLRQYLDFLDYQGEIQALAVDRPLLRRYLARLRRGAEGCRPLGDRSLARKLSSLRSFYRFLNRTGRLAVNPAELLDPPKLEKRLPVFAEEGWVHRMMALPDTTQARGLRDRCILELLYGTRARRATLSYYERYIGASEWSMTGAVAYGQRYLPGYQQDHAGPNQHN